MQVVILAIERHKDPDFEKIIYRYIERMVKPWTVKEIIISAPKTQDVALSKSKEAALIEKQIKSEDIVVLCDERGKSYTSMAFAQQLESWSSNARGRLIFVIGGAFGLDAGLLKKYPLIKLSEFVLPHQLARLILTEQLYRAVSILKGTAYHHE